MNNEASRLCYEIPYKWTTNACTQHIPRSIATQKYKKINENMNTMKRIHRVKIEQWIIWGHLWKFVVEIRSIAGFEAEVNSWKKEIPIKFIKIKGRSDEFHTPVSSKKPIVNREKKTIKHTISM